jgi:hypothetical protein
MLVIGLGKRHGADQVHSFGTRGLRDMIPESGQVILKKTPFIGGLAIVENAKEETAKLEVVDRDDLWTREPELLIEARGLMGRLPFKGADVLIIGECGKNYSGAGMDPNVVGRMLIEATPEAETNDPRIVRIGVLDVSPESPRERDRDRHRRPDHNPRAGRDRPGPVPDEQPDRPLPVAVEAADRVRHRPRGDRHLRGDVLAAGAGEGEVLRHPEHAGGGRDVGVGTAGRGPEGRSAPGVRRRLRGVCRSTRAGTWSRRSCSRTASAGGEGALKTEGSGPQMTQIRSQKSMPSEASDLFHLCDLRISGPAFLTSNTG